MDEKCISCKEGAKSKGESEDLKGAELERQIASLLKQPRVIEFIKRLESIEEAVRQRDVRR